MTSYRLRIFGITLAEVQVDVTTVEQPVPNAPVVSMAGGSGHNFERDLYAPDPADAESRHFGFHR